MIPNTQGPFRMRFGDKQGGAFVAIGHRGPYGDTLPSGSLIGSYKWLDDAYGFLLTGFDYMVEAAAAPTAGGFVKLSLKKSTNITVDTSGALPMTSFATPKCSTMMSDATLLTKMQVINAPSGVVGLTVGTRTLSNELFSPIAYIEKKGTTVAGATVDLLIEQGGPVYLEKNEGLELSVSGALPAGSTYSIHTTVRFLVLPKEIIEEMLA